MCSTNEPKVRRETGATVRAGSRPSDAECTGLPGSLEAARREPVLPVLLQGQEGDDQRDDRDERADDDEVPQRLTAAVVRAGELLPQADADGERVELGA